MTWLLTWNTWLRFTKKNMNNFDIYFTHRQEDTHLYTK